MRKGWIASLLLILLSCRPAAEVLVSLGYTNVKKFGGILDWPYETE